jgi:hypothetical protein
MRSNAYGKTKREIRKRKDLLANATDTDEAPISALYSVGSPGKWLYRSNLHRDRWCKYQSISEERQKHVH